MNEVLNNNDFGNNNIKKYLFFLAATGVAGYFSFQSFFQYPEIQENTNSEKTISIQLNKTKQKIFKVIETPNINIDTNKSKIDRNVVKKMLELILQALNDGNNDLSNLDIDLSSLNDNDKLIITKDYKNILLKYNFVDDFNSDDFENLSYLTNEEISILFAYMNITLEKEGFILTTIYTYILENYKVDSEFTIDYFIYHLLSLSDESGKSDVLLNNSINIYNKIDINGNEEGNMELLTSTKGFINNYSFVLNEGFTSKNINTLKSGILESSQFKNLDYIAQYYNLNVLLKDIIYSTNLEGEEANLKNELINYLKEELAYVKSLGNVNSDVNIILEQMNNASSHLKEYYLEVLEQDVMDGDNIKPEIVKANKLIKKCKGSSNCDYDNLSNELCKIYNM